MNESLARKLIEKYPKIFPNCGIECGDGWFWLIDELCGSIQSFVDNNKSKTLTNEELIEETMTERFSRMRLTQVVACQVKEKFGTLRFYSTGGDTFTDGMICLAERMSGKICEYCGKTEDIKKTSGWIKSLCPECFEKYEK